METIKNLAGFGSSNGQKPSEARPVDFSDPSSFQSNINNPGSERAMQDASHSVAKPAEFTQGGFQSNNMYGGDPRQMNDDDQMVAKPQEYRGEKGYHGNIMYGGDEKAVKDDGEVAREHGVGQGEGKDGVMDKIAGVVTSNALGGDMSK